jgi:hypothetical protein
MASTDNSENQGQIVGTLSSEEKGLLVQQVNSTIKVYKYCLILSYVLILLGIGIILVPALYISINKQKKKLLQLTNNDLQVYRATSVLSRKNKGYRGAMYVYYLGSFMLPGEVFPKNDPSGIQEHLRETISAEYIPDIAKNRSYTDSQGHGYNFITKTAS